MDAQAKLDEWNVVKKEVDSKTIEQRIAIQRIYWVNVGQNVGGEVYGKGRDFIRPVLVLRVFFNRIFLGVPLSSKTRNKTGRLYNKFIDSKGRLQVALLGQIRVFDIKRVANYISKVEKGDFEKIRAKIRGEII